MSESATQFVNLPAGVIPAAPGRGRVKARAGLMVVLVMQLSIAGAQQEAEPAAPSVDTESWVCDYCAFEEGWYSDLTLGVGSVSDDSYKFGEYNGLQEEGSYLIGEANARYRGEDAVYLDLSASDLGLDTRSLAIEGGRQGSYDIFLRYDEIPHYISNSASSPYLGSGGDTLTLPAGWVNASSTSAMTALAPNLREVDLKTERKRLGTGISITTESPWSYHIDLRHEDKEGNKPGGGAFLFNSAQLVEPVDYVTDEIDASVSYTTRRWQGKLAYYVSTFSNGNESLTWENAYTPIVAGADEGRLALPPDNEFQQLSLSLAYRINDRNQVSGDIAVGSMKQDEKLLQATQNTALLVAPLPADSADVEVDTTNARLKFTTMATDNLSLSAIYSHDERDNRTPQRMYEWVSTDAVVASQRSNLPYSYTRDAVKIKADYNYDKGLKLGAGYDIDERERTFQEVDETSEDTLWGSIRVRGSDTLFAEFKIATSSRDAASSEVVAAIDPPQNVLMAKYNTADRQRDSVGVFVSFMPHPDYSIGIGFDSARDDYNNSEIGLTDSEDNSMNLDVTAMLSEDVSVNAFIGKQIIKSSQAGSQGFSTADWFATTRDTFENIGVGVNFIVIEETLNIGADISVARSTGEIEVDSGAPAAAFPDLNTDLETIRLYLDYRMSENLTLQAAYWHETFDSSDWALEGLDADTVSNLLSFDQQSPDYSNDVVKLAMHYRF